MVYRLFLVVLFSLLSLIAQITALMAQPLVIHDVHVLSMENDQILDHQTIIVEDGIIRWVGDAEDAEMPLNAEVANGNFYVMPGLSEMHAHIPQPGQGEQVMKDALALYLSQGITTIRGMLGHPAHLDLRDQAAAGEIDSPRIFTSGPSFSGGSVDSPEQARQMVRQQADAAYDLLNPTCQERVFPGSEARF
jgi:imidazolonepropionase-like amidohydrolase